jgi:hypothetical protein
MWGNRLGWTISAGIVLAAIAILLLIATSSSRTPPTAFSKDERNFGKLAVPEPPPISQPATNGGGSYRSAISAYLENRALYEDFATMGTLKSPKVAQLAAIDKIVNASPQSELFAKHPREVIGYQNSKPAIEALSVLGRVMIDRLALLNQREGNVEAARKYALAGAALGEALSRERLCWDEFALGQELLSKSAAILGKGDDGAAWKAFDEQRSQFFNDQIDPTIRMIRSIDPKTVGTHTGDVFQLAKRSQERMWRVEAILALGRVRFFTGTSRSAADQRAALAAVKKIADEDPDPIIRAAAEAARDLTAEQYRMQ